jgi:hypothetical protein
MSEESASTGQDKAEYAPQPEEFDGQDTALQALPEEVPEEQARAEQQRAEQARQEAQQDSPAQQRQAEAEQASADGETRQQEREAGR